MSSLSSLRAPLRRLAFVLLLLLTLVLGATSLLEQVRGTAFAVGHVYHAPWFALLWAALALTGLGSLAVGRDTRLLRRQVLLWLVHGALALILLGAGVSALTSRTGRIHLRQGVTERAYVPEGERHRLVRLPFSIRLDTFRISRHPGSGAVSGFVSEVCIDGKACTVETNRVTPAAGYRLFQYAYDADGRGSVILVRYDPWGRPLTYAGYALLLSALLLTLVAPWGGLRRSLRALRRAGSLCLAAMLTLSPLVPLEGQAQRVLPREVADRFGTLPASYGGRICPVQTVAQDFCRELCGTAAWGDYSAEQVLTGFLLWPGDWAEVPLIRLRPLALRHRLGLERQTSYGSLRRALDSSSDLPLAWAGEARRLCGMVEAVGKGEWLRLYPVRDGDGTQWLSRSELQADTVWALRYGRLAATADVRAWPRRLDSLEAAQRLWADGTLPPEATLRAERLYNACDLPRVLSRLLLLGGLLALGGQLRRGQSPRRAAKFVLWLIGGSWLALTAFLTLRSLVSGRLPLGNGYETMLTAAWFSLLAGGPWAYRLRGAPLLAAIPLLAAGFFLLTASLTRSGAEISQLPPVLDSPWLQFHVSLVMGAYALLAFTFLHAVISLLRGAADRRSVWPSRLLLYPALSLLAAGIVTGALWADSSWGRYWGWDPKEVWALITLLVYSLPLHWSVLRPFRSPRFHHLYLVLAFATVLMTYFGVNYWLGGLHGYAG